MSAESIVTSGNQRDVLTEHGRTLGHRHVADDCAKLAVRRARDGIDAVDDHAHLAHPLANARGDGALVRGAESRRGRDAHPHQIELLLDDLRFPNRRNTVEDGIERTGGAAIARDRKSTRLNSSHSQISYAVFCLKKKT